jgi:beta-ketoacyl-acyl-carrier-protein synthase II
MGAVSPIGLTAESSWQNAVQGVSGVGPLTLFEVSDVLVKIACEVKNFDPTASMDAREARRRDRFEQFASVACAEAMRQAGLTIDAELSPRTAIIMSSAIGGITTIEEGLIKVLHEGWRRISPFTIPMFMSNGAAGMIAIDYGVHGPCFSLASACASGADAIGMAGVLIRSGTVDVVIAGASDATITRIGVASFDRLNALSRRNEDYSLVPAPFDKNRDGLVMGEGAAVLVLENLEFARSRGATILAELVGYGSTADASHVTAPPEDGTGAAAAIRGAMKSAGLAPEDVGYINAHGTATPLNDLAETNAIKRALGDHAYKIPISSTKSMTGHMMGATGALEAIFCIQAIRTGILPPTIHYQTPDPACDLDFIPNQARRARVEVALDNAFGFGGHNAVLAFRAYRQ